MFSFNTRKFSYGDKELEAYEHTQYSIGWSTYGDDDHELEFQKLIEHAQEFVWSPIVWRPNRCKGTNFAHSQYLVYDIDQGASMEAVHASIRGANYTHAILPTRHHNVAKHGQPACERFRVILPLTRRITALYAYSAAYKYLIDKSHALRTADKTFDGARKFLPSTSVAYFHKGRRLIPPLLGPQDFDFDYELRERRKKQRALARMSTSSMVPIYDKLTRTSKAILQTGLIAGRRNQDLFCVACDLATKGKDEAQILDFCERHFGVDMGGLPTSEVRSIIESAIKKAQQNN